MIARGQNFKEHPLRIAGSSVFGRYPKINSERTYNMFVSDAFLVPYAGYKSVIQSLGTHGRALHNSTKLGKMICVVDNKVYTIDLSFNQLQMNVEDVVVAQIGTLNTTSGTVYITENNKPQVVISDGVSIYFYDETLTPSFQQCTLNFTPGFIDFHDTYILAAASQDQTYTPAAYNTWRLGTIDTGTGKLVFPSDAQHVGLLSTKPDNTQAVIRFPSKGNMILVMGKTVTEFWFDVGGQLFPYQRNNQGTIDYGCVSPSTIATNDEMAVWLAQNEKSGPIIMYSDGGMPEKITTDGIDYLFSTLQNPSDSRAFLYRQDGHLFYQINFYTDNFSLVYDFNTKSFYNITDENMNYFIGNSIAFFNNQYYFVSKNDGNLYAFDTEFTTYDGAKIPRIRICNNIREPDQQWRIANDIGFTIESGETNYDNQQTIINSEIVTINNPPSVDLAVSRDGGATFGSNMRYYLPPIGQRKNKLMWWQIGAFNDLVPKFEFNNIGRCVATDGIVNVRQ